MVSPEKPQRRLGRSAGSGDAAAAAIVCPSPRQAASPLPSGGEPEKHGGDCSTCRSKPAPPPSRLSRGAFPSAPPSACFTRRCPIMPRKSWEKRHSRERSPQLSQKHRGGNGTSGHVQIAGVRARKSSSGKRGQKGGPTLDHVRRGRPRPPEKESAGRRRSCQAQNLRLPLTHGRQSSHLEHVKGGGQEQRPGLGLPIPNAVPAAECFLPQGQSVPHWADWDSPVSSEGSQHSSLPEKECSFEQPLRRNCLIP